MKVYSINSITTNRQNQTNMTQIKSQNSTVSFGVRGGHGFDGPGPESMEELFLALTAPIWGPFYLGYKGYEALRAHHQKKLEAKIEALAEEKYGKEYINGKSPEQMLINFISISTLPKPGLGLNKVIGKEELKVDLHTKILSPMVAAINGDTNLVETNSLPNSVVLFGPQGTGKTYIAEALGEHVKELGMNYVEPEIDAFDSVSSVKNIRNAFKNAEKEFKETGKYTLIYIDELDSFATDRKLSIKHLDEVNALLKLTEDCSQRGAILIAATNNIKYIDRALMDRVTLTLPMEPMQPHEIFDTLVYHLVKGKGIESAKDLDYNKIVKELDSYENKYSPRNINEITKHAMINYKINKGTILTEDIIEILQNSVHPRINNQVIAEFNDEINFARNHGYIKNNYTDFKFMKGE